MIKIIIIVSVNIVFKIIIIVSVNIVFKIIIVFVNFVFKIKPAFCGACLS